MMRKILLLALILSAASPVLALETKYVTLNDGHKMPVFGLGTWTLDNAQAEESVYIAIKEGYRLIDTARYYRNESGVGRGVRRAVSEGLIKREDIFITSKILHGYNPDEAVNDSVKALGLDYVDLMLIHQPGYNDEECYKALERAVKSGKVKSIGISNYYTPGEFERINRIASITPAIVQNENHIYYQNTELQEYLKRYGTFIESWYPLGGRGNTREILNNEAVKKIAASHGKTTAQIIIRWHIQAGYIVIPGSKNPEHIRENINVFDFALTDDEMKIIADLNQARRFENW
ncbi:MAG: aldo/keto reductase [Synergistaceae bacterium]|nr:aldo/keto reductase [Synergistaceae bacterium]